MNEVFVPIALFAIAPIIIWIVSMNGQKRAADLQATVQKAIEKGVELTPETIRALGVKPKSPYGDLRGGVILLAIASAFIVLGFGIETVEPDEKAVPILASVAAFPGFIGLALIAMHFLLKNKNTDE
ncbi:hypothetical protein MNBD_ALPHA06-157 [hydrothermal vent metagenome]|uniref:DUF6249 domain-containing protein n=1 Tax=hydrothermal vent metagenome TaxID=652676 RepID=A0A3B0RS68_9ZZZZ